MQGYTKAQNACWGPEKKIGLLCLQAKLRLIVPPGKAYKLLTGHLITGYPLRSEPAKEKWFKSNHLYISIFGLVGRLL